MADTEYTDYLDGDYTAPAGSAVDVFIGEIVSQQDFAVFTTKTASITPATLTVTVGPGQKQITIPQPKATAMVKVLVPELLSFLMENGGIWGTDTANSYPLQEEGQGWWTDNNGFVMTGNPDTYFASRWTILP